MDASDYDVQESSDFEPEMVPKAVGLQLTLSGWN